MTESTATGTVPPQRSHFLSGVVARGVAAGIVGATVLALWFLVVDSSQGTPFRTPNFVAGSLLGNDSMDMGVGPILLYTFVHYAAFIVVGLVASWVLVHVETASPMLLGLVLGFLQFDVVFYGSVAITGVDVVQALGWPEVLAGNLLAGMAVLYTLHVTGATRPITWWETLEANNVVREGVVTGLIGATVVAVWFLLFDVMRGRPFFTPGALGSALFLGSSTVDAVTVNATTVIGYTVLHVLAFVVTGFFAAAIVTAADDAPPLILGAVLFFAAFEAFFMAL
ncbi:MAG: hypothetical protein EXR95_10415, partial [Gemmatimonadetes bacterium]|nr:hypothetical protein [Gemmatimonadota bacterium]